MTNVGSVIGYHSAHVGIAPCVGCAHHEMCKTEQLACRDFRLYVFSNRLANRQRAPSRAMYRNIFDEHPHG